MVLVALAVLVFCYLLVVVSASGPIELAAAQICSHQSERCESAKWSGTSPARLVIRWEICPGQTGVGNSTQLPLYALRKQYALPTTHYAEDLQYHTPCYSLPSLPSLPSTTTTVTSKVFCIPACLMHEKNIEACRCLCVACYLDSPFSMLLR